MPKINKKLIVIVVLVVLTIGTFVAGGWDVFTHPFAGTDMFQ